MVSENYKWRRFWSPRGSVIRLADRGYLLDPESDFGRIANPDLVTLDYLADVPCLVLLGERGIGKSTDLRAEYDKNLSRQSGDDIIQWLDLRSYGSEVRLANRLFENRDFDKWIHGKHRWLLFLDSFDECQIKIPALSTLLIDEFKERAVPVDRLCLRLACRTALWPNILESELKEIWGGDCFQIFEMAPLTAGNVRTAAAKNALDAKNFLLEIDRKEVVPLAIKPVTMELLIGVFGQDERLPTSSVELYERGLRRLCEEFNQSRIAARMVGQFSADQRLEVASRIAALTTICGKTGIWIGGDQKDRVETDIPVWEIAGGTETVRASKFEVADSVLFETLDTGLFGSLGMNRMGWGHGAYAEFLSARYLARHEITFEQFMGLITQHEGQSTKLPPQMRGTAAWLASMRPDIFREIIKTDPDVLLRSDTSTVTDADREALVDSLLLLYHEESLLDPITGSRHLYKKLQHPGLARQLLSYIRDPSKGFLARCEALDMARFCRLDEIKEDALQIFLDRSDDERVRRSAGHALLRIGDETTRSEMKPLAFGENPEDTLDELKGCALEATWPDYLTVEELLQAITFPKRQNLVGTYSGFIKSSLLQRVNPSDLPTLLKWVAGQPARETLPELFQELMGNIILFAWDYLENVDVMAAFGEAILSRLKLDYSVTEYRESRKWLQLIEDDRRRRTLLTTLVEMLGDPDEDVETLFSHETPVVLGRDIPWLTNRLDSAETATSRMILIKLIRGVFNSSDPSQVEILLTQIEKDALLAREFEWLWKPIELGSPEALRMREKYNRLHEKDKYVEERNRRIAEQYSAMMLLLRECECGKPASFSLLTEKMILQPGALSNNLILEGDLRRLPGWEKSDAETRKRIVKAARMYLERNDADPDNWLGTRRVDSNVFAGYKAFRLIFGEAPNELSNIPLDVWGKWASTLLDFPMRLGFRDDQTLPALVATAYEIVPQEIIKALLFLIDNENRRDSGIAVIQKIRLCRGTQIEKALIRKLSDNSLTPRSFGDILDELLARDLEQARHFGEQLVRDSPQLPGIDREKAVMAATLLAIHSKDADWPVIWPVIERDKDFGLQVIPKIATFDRNYDAGIINRLSEQSLGILFTWLARNYPYEKDPNEEEWHEVGAREEIADWRNSILMQLRDRGTQQAVEAIENIKSQLSDLHVLNWILIEAKNRLRHNAWTPPSPARVLEVVVEDFGPVGHLIEIHDVDEFAKIVSVPPASIDSAILSEIRQLDERTQMEPFIRQILFDPNETAHGPIELADIVTSVHVKGEKCLAGFVLKGRSFNPVSNRSVSHQFEKLATIRELRVAIFAAVGTIQDEVQRNFSMRARNEGWLWTIINAMDLARLFIAYGKICSQDGTPFCDQTKKCKHGHLQPG
jgi:predicted NACHT family NTPase